MFVVDDFHDVSGVAVIVDLIVVVVAFWGFAAGVVDVVGVNVVTAVVAADTNGLCCCYYCCCYCCFCCTPGCFCCDWRPLSAIQVAP